MEIEIKARVGKIEPLLEFLKINAELKYEGSQVDKYYTPAHRDFLSVKPVKEWLRLRDSNGKFSIDYKNWIYNSDGKSNHCDEFETKIDSLEKAENILGALDFKYLITVDKFRSAWNYKEYEISIDKVEDLGDFVEIEYIGSNAGDPKEVTDEMILFLTSMQCGELNRDYKGYPFLLLEKYNLI